MSCWTIHPLAAAPTQLTVDEALAPHVYVFYAAFIIAFVFTPVMRVVAMYYRIVDRPDQARKVHKVEVAYLGGVAMFLGWVAGLAMSQLSSGYYDQVGGWQHVRVSPAILLGAIVIVALGLWDDIKHVNPNYKIVGEVLAAGALLAAGIGRNATRPLLGPIDHRMIDWFHAPLPDWLYFLTGACLTVALVVFCCNAVNLMDGLDGLAGGVTGVIALGFLFLVTYLAVISGPENAAGSALRLVLVMALLGAVLGFVPYNFNPASIFMGDTGSLFLGFNCATLILLMAEVDSRWLLAALVMFALPVLDTSLAFARRWVNRRPVFSADRMHFHHQLVMRGLTVRKTVIVSYILSIGFVLLGASVVFMRTRFAFAIYLVVFGSIIVAAFKMGMVHEKSVVTSRRPIGAAGTVAAPLVEPGSVLEVREDEKRRQNGDEG
jgi:UDP-GlcNAc:undecaprenyl-phosphate GlcNAc-1-phosphate transferase